MAMLRTLSMLLGALAVLWLGAVAAPASASAEAPPCHEMTMSHGMAPDAPAPSPDKPMKSMSCCIACVATPLPQPPVRAAIRAPAPLHASRLQAQPVGRTTQPEPGPPRTVAA
jgi:hypothetical protein